MKRFLLALLFVVVQLPALSSAEDRLRLATTTSTDNSGLLAVLHPAFEAAHNIKVDVIAVGTGKALRLGQNGDVDLVMVHAPAAEKKFVADGWGTERLPVMHNDFVVLGPSSDPAGVRGANSIAEAMARISNSADGFISRGDDSGTHKKELSIWQSAGLVPEGDWYMAAGQGMGAVIRIADDKEAYTIADRGTYLSFIDKIGLKVVYAGDAVLYNPYHVIRLNAERHPHIKADLAAQYVAFIRGPLGQKIIGDFRRGGEQLFHPDVIEQ